MYCIEVCVCVCVNIQNCTHTHTLSHASKDTHDTPHTMCDSRSPVCLHWKARLEKPHSVPSMKTSSRISVHGCCDHWLDRHDLAVSWCLLSCGGGSCLKQGTSDLCVRTRNDTHIIVHLPTKRKAKTKQSTCVHTCIPTYKQKYIHTCRHVYMHTCIHIYTSILECMPACIHT